MNLDFFEKYKYKIKSKNELKKILKKNKSKRTIMCHGVFDIVHPGHVRHLIHAKNRADILIVSLTSDKFISKGKFRPHVPEKIRSLNISAFEMVDYVIIDNEKTPINLIKYLKPNLFAKGFEYSANEINKNTIIEEKTVRSYGGRMVFTPGDIIYSSSNLLNFHSPQIEGEKLISLMYDNKITFNQLRQTISKFKNFKIHIVGDTIIDGYTYTSLSNSRNKTPTFSVIRNKVENYLGGAAIVASHIRAAGANVTFTTVAGKDAFSKLIYKECSKRKIKLNLIIDETRPTTYKNVFISNGYRLLKVDDVVNNSISQSIKNKISKLIKTTNSNGVVFSDFRHGIFNEKNISIFTKSIRNKNFKIADSQVASRWGNISDFKNFDLITPNELEARFALAKQDSSIYELSKQLIKKSKSKNIILKLGSNGIFCLENKNINKYFTLGSFVKKLTDPVGAGDALCSYAALGLMASGSIKIASILGSMAAACECEFDGNIPVEPIEVLKKIDYYEKFSKL